MNAEQKLKLPESPDRLGNLADDKEPSPFKIYEDKYCSRCQDYFGCIGLIDNLAVKMQNPDTMKGLPDEMAAFIKHLMESSGMGSGQRFSLITTCMGARNYMEKQLASENAALKEQLENEKIAMGRKRKKPGV